jgi:membrane-associated protease RseP (regulator of RpoE activity)
LKTLFEFQNNNENEVPPVKSRQDYRFLINIILFLLTFFTTTIAGIMWLNIPDFYELDHFQYGLPYSCSLLFILACHEFGHYFASRKHKVDATLPYFIPIPAMPEFINFGTLGAVIKTKSPIPSNKAMFDIGAAGPISGFIASLLILIWGFTHLPSIQYLFNIHLEYAATGIATNGLTFGNTILYEIMSKIFVNTRVDFLPPMNEIYHYPFLCTGWFGLFITSMNLLPVGQLDGGHISYTLFGSKNHTKIAWVTFILFLVFGALGFIQLIDEKFQFGWAGWFFWAIFTFFVIKLKHPVIGEFYEPLDFKRKILGWFNVFILCTCFSPVPFSINF